jgi:type IV secretory pathway VirJ component
MTTTATPTTWPTQLLLPGQAAAPEGPVDMTMMYVMHYAFRRDLTAFAAAAAATPVDDQPTWQALNHRWQLFAEALHHHHSGEDAGLWPLLTARADEEGRQLLQAMEEEHSEIDPILEAVTAGLARLATTADADTKAALVVRLCAGKESLARHLAHEETEAIALVQQLMTDAEWRQLDEEHFKKGITPRTVIRLLPWVMHQQPPAAVERLVGSAPAAQKILWRLTRPGFERRERRAFRYIG